MAKSAVSSSGMHFLNFAGADFRAVCPAESAKAFPEGGPTALYKGKPVEIRGELQLYNGTPQIQIRAPSQVSVLDGSGSGGGEAFCPDGGVAAQVSGSAPPDCVTQGGTRTG
ncbi:MAG: hypothetical protein R3F11_01280 [Verrucomicrobiales bacterium]